MENGSGKAPPTLNILLIDDNSERRQVLQAALDNSRYRLVHLLSSSAPLLKQVDALQPDVIIIDIESPSRDILASLHTLSSFNPKPVVMFSAEQDSDVITQSVKSGVSAYVVGDADPARVKAILDAAVARFAEFQQLRSELDKTRQELQSRQLIDQAKRILMKQKSLSEEQAFNAIRKTAMNSGQKLEQVASTMIALFSSLNDQES